jgi:quinol monooxygenase YgiN
MRLSASIWRHLVLTTSVLTAKTRAFGVPTLFSASLSLARPQQRAAAISTTQLKMADATTTTAVQSKPFAVIVQAEIQPDRLGEFLQLIETNAVETRKEPKCLRFDVVQSQEAKNKFFFYELYQSVDAIDYHKAQPHYALWANFKESGGVISSTTFKSDGLFLS